MLLGRDKFKRIPWAQLFIESILVVLSVLLALALNNWNQNRIHDDLAAQGIRNLADEIRYNKKEVANALHYHQSLLDSLRKNHDMGISLRAATIQNNAWETAQATQAAAYIDYDIAAQASRIHDLQEMYQQYVQIAVQTIYLGTNPGRSPAQMSMLLDLRGWEQKLLKEYKKLLELIEA